MPEITVAIAKGRLQQECLARLERAGLGATLDALNSRRLAVEDRTGVYRFLFVKPSDVPVYVEHGIADCGVVGRDVLLETDADLLQPLDLGFGKCRIVVAAKDGRDPLKELGMIRVATKYPHVTHGFFGSRGIPVEIITLSGSVELAPVLGLSDCIVDLVETGRTLEENGLKVVSVIAESTARLVVNRASYQLKSGPISSFIKILEQQSGAQT
jgi:ATP phosphoribosyltransferase